MRNAPHQSFLGLRRAPAVATLALTLGLAACPSPTPESRKGDDATPSAQASPSGEATLFLMADIRGVLRPCGCTVDLQKGGFDRLVPYLAKERKSHPKAQLFHAGPLFFEDATVDPKKRAQRSRQAEVAADLVARADIDVAAATCADAVASEGHYGDLAKRAHVQMTAANLKLNDGPSISPFEVREVGGLRVGVFALADPNEGKDLDGKGTVEDPVAAAARIVPEIRKRADVVLLLSALGLRETKRLIRKVDGVDFCVVGGMGEHPTVSDEAELVGSTRLMQFHREGRFVGRLSIRMVDGSRDFADASEVSEAELAEIDHRIQKLADSLAAWEKTGGADEYQIRSAKHHLASLKDERDRLATRKSTVPATASAFSFTSTPLNWDLPQDPDTLALMDAFDEELARINIANAGTLPEAKPGEAVYVGVKACLECHDEVESFWKHDRHAEAWATLEKDKKTFDAECVSCHVTGYGRAGGSLVGHTEGRENVQCEACHGPGSKHAEDGDPDLIVREPTVEVCVGCHNSHHSPTFDFAVYKPKLMVPGHGKPVD
ncbi:MAG: hypothetical protein KC635_11505 [Myxococcales bacterium]|nr:hypothetical protein [Myxococcales bacterium]MCB9734415.1 hypothetical protein [Deltaproteobacteria bacterium]